MKEALICFVLILVVGSVINTLRRVDVWGSTDTPGSPASQVLMVNESTFDKDVLGASTPVLVDFYKNDSGDCSAMVPAIVNVAQRMKNKLKVVRIDIAESPLMARRYGVQVLPDLILFRDEQNIDHLPGVVAEEKLLTFLDQALKKNTGDVLMTPINSGRLGSDNGPAKETEPVETEQAK